MYEKTGDLCFIYLFQHELALTFSLQFVSFVRKYVVFYRRTDIKNVSSAFSKSGHYLLYSKLKELIKKSWMFAY